VEGLIDEEEDMIFKIGPKLFLINIIIISDEIISLLNVGVLKIRISEDFNLKQGTSKQIATEVGPSTTKPKDFYFRSKISLEDKVYP
jgi:hypothetical protein